MESAAYASTPVADRKMMEFIGSLAYPLFSLFILQDTLLIDLATRSKEAPPLGSVVVDDVLNGTNNFLLSLINCAPFQEVHFSDL